MQHLEENKTESKQTQDASIEERATFTIVRYANCWEDANILCEALKASPGKRFVSIASGGDNAFALLSEGAEVIAVDLSEAQLAIVELKKVVISKVSHAEYLEFLGVNPSSNREQLYKSLRAELPSTARNYWDKQLSVINVGLVHSGKFEKYFQSFRKFVLPFIHSKSKINHLLEPRNSIEQQEFYDKYWNTWRWRSFFKLFFGRKMMGLLGRDPEFFRYVEGDVGTLILNRAEQALRYLDHSKNPYLTYILTGNYNEHALPHYMQKENYTKLAKSFDNLTLVNGGILDAIASSPAESIDGYNLSDIFEYLNEDLCREIFSALIEKASPGARFAYWNMLVPRFGAKLFPQQLTFLEDKSLELFKRDEAIFYSRFIVDEKI